MYKPRQVDILFPKEFELKIIGKCPFCKQKIVFPDTFRDELSRKEYQISGLCQKCQDEVWGDDSIFGDE